MPKTRPAFGELYSVLVGVDDYRLLDQSLGLPSGTSDNRGAVSDCLEWARFARKMDMGRPQAALLYAPAEGASPSATHPSQSPPTAASMLEYARGLADRLRRNPLARGLFAYSGHAELSPQGETLLLGVEARWERGQVRGLPLSALAEALGGAELASRLTLVLDCCHPGALPADAQDRPRQAARPGGAAPRAQPVELPFPTLLAAAPGEVAMEIPAGPQWRGAFSWAALRIIQRWGLAGDPPGVPLSQAELLKRTHALLQAMGVQQRPQWQGPPQMKGLAVFSHRPVSEIGPPRVLDDREIWAGTLDLTDLSRGKLGRLHITDSQPAAGLLADQAYWLNESASANPVLSSDHFELSLSAQLTPPTPLSPMWMQHSNGLFKAYSPLALPLGITRWYRWSRATAASTFQVGWLGVVPGQSGKLVWLSTVLVSQRVGLMAGERFVFEKVPAVNLGGVSSISVDSLPVL